MLLFILNYAFRGFRTKLVWYSGNKSTDEYFVFGRENNGSIKQSMIIAELQKGPFVCFEGETDLENLMAGNFKSLRRNDCSFRENEVIRWAWEAWRLAVGVKVGEIFPKAAGLMNEGARRNGIA